MKKTKSKKLTLNRETLIQLAAVVGSESGPGYTEWVTCATCVGQCGTRTC